MLERRRLLVLAMAMALAGLATACGVKGPLYLPEESETGEEKDEEEKKTSRRAPAPARATHT